MRPFRCEHQRFWERKNRANVGFFLDSSDEGLGWFRILRIASSHSSSVLYVNQRVGTWGLKTMTGRGMTANMLGSVVGLGSTIGLAPFFGSTPDVITTFATPLIRC